MGVAFEIALATLRPPDSDPLREAVAWKIIELAKAGERDPERLCDGALKDLPPAVSVPPLALPPAGSQLSAFLACHRHPPAIVRLPSEQF
jgi:hypothetical protein